MTRREQRQGTRPPVDEYVRIRGFQLTCPLTTHD